MTDKGSACEKLCAEIRSSGVAPNAACGYWAQGQSGPVVGGETDALFDLASVTKSFFAVACARAGIREKMIRGVPLELMLAHRAGFPAHLPLFAPMVDGARVEVAAAIESAWASRSGPLPSPPLYSDVGYLLAGFDVAGDHVDDFVRSNVPIEVGSARRMDMTRAVPTEHVAWRGGEVRGHVHDENAWALGGDGACAHAGLFGTIDAVLRFGAFVLDHLGELDWLVRERDGGTLRAGFDGKSSEGSSAGTVLGPRSFGHLGFTGTSVWIDPDARIVVALLTNRVCPTRDNVKIREARPRVHDALASLAR
jgi:CubicO group peptidase (beta-lactamase class C family)